MVSASLACIHLLLSLKFSHRVERNRLDFGELTPKFTAAPFLLSVYVRAIIVARLDHQNDLHLPLDAGSFLSSRIWRCRAAGERASSATCSFAAWRGSACNAGSA